MLIDGSGGLISFVQSDHTQMGKQPMAEATKVVKTLDEAVQANRGSERFCRAFGISEWTLARWRDIGVPRTHALGLYLGLRVRCCEFALSCSA